MMDNDYFAFQELVKEYVHLDVLILALKSDQKRISELKMGSVYIGLLDQALIQLENQVARLKQRLRVSDGKIVSIRQEDYFRTVEYTFKGYQHKASFLNELIRVECEQKLLGSCRQS